MSRPICLILLSLAVALSAPVHAQGAQVPASAASRVMMRGDMPDIRVEEIRAQRRNEVLVVQTELVNTGVRDLQVYYRYRWLDQDGMQSGEPEVWKAVHFLGKQSQFLRGTAPNLQAADFRLEMSAEPR